MYWLWLIPVVLLAAGVVAALAWRPIRARRREREAIEARQRFVQQREHLEAKFLTAAAATGKPRGLRWMDCEMERELELARDRRTGQLVGLVSATIRFEAIEGGDMEGLPAVGNLRNASAVFFYQRGRWQTAGKAVFNLNPDEALEHFKQQYERVG